MAIEMTEEEKILNAMFQNVAASNKADFSGMNNSIGGNISQANNWDAFNANALQEFNNQNSVNSFDESQLQGLISQESNYQNKANEARDIRTAAANAPKKPFVPSMDNWNWAYGGQGIPEVELTPFDSSEGETSSLYSLGYGLTPESSNMDIMSAVRDLDNFDNPEDQERFQSWMEPSINADPSAMFDWANITNPEQYTLNISDNDLAPENKAWFNRILNSIYTSDAASNSAPAGYANPSVNGYANPNPSNSTGAN